MSLQEKATQKGVVRAVDGKVGDRQIELYEARLRTSIKKLTKKSVEIRSQGRTQGGNPRRTSEEKRRSILRQTLRLQSKLKECEPEKECMIDGHKYSAEDVVATLAKVQAVIQRQRDAVREKKNRAVAAQVEAAASRRRG